MEAARLLSQICEIELRKKDSCYRWLEEIGQREAALDCCNSLGEKGKELKMELCAALSPPLA